MRHSIGCSMLSMGLVILFACNAGAGEEDAWKIAASSPYAAYPETVTYTLGKLIGSNNSNMPAGDTYEDNAYTRYLLNMINVQNKDLFEAADKQYDMDVEMCLATGDLPDVMTVGDQEVLQRLVEADLIEDLTPYYETCASDGIKQMYASYSAALMENASVNGRLMALPETNINDGPNLLWLRRDWLNALGLESPTTIEEAAAVIEAFIKEDPGHNGDGQTLGLILDTQITGENGYSAEYLADLIFASCGSYPRQWILNEDGDVVYGSVQPEAKEALAVLQDWYAKGILDQNFLLRDSSNLIDLVVSGRCGSFFGPWWAPNNPLMEAVAANADAVWEPFLIATDSDGITSYHSQNPSYKYVVVRKGYEHPEIVFKIASVMFDWIRYEDPENEEFARYYQDNVDPTARPLAINIDYSNALEICYNAIIDVLEGTRDVSSLPLLERSYYEQVSRYLEDQKSATKEIWAAYVSRISACSLIASENTKEVKSLYFGTTRTMMEKQTKLNQMALEAYLKIITGTEPLDSFDDFAASWYQEGGDVITNEVREALRDSAVMEETTEEAVLETAKRTPVGVSEEAEEETPDGRVFYEVFVRSFYDSDGDGIGDLNGVTEKLDYICDLGCTGIWLMPICPSPTYHKYDVTDYESVDEQYGTLEDYQTLIAQAHARGMVVITDMVFNHTSSGHPWFQTACSYLEGLEENEEPDFSICPEAGYYHFSREKKNGSYYQVGSSNWYYEGVFWSEMPDLDLENTQVRAEIEKIANFWLELGTDGFRLDAAKEYVSGNGTKNVEILSWFTQYVKSVKKNAYLVAEVWDSTDVIARYYASGIDSIFDYTFGSADGQIALKTNQAGNGKAGGAFGRNLMNVEASYRDKNPNFINAPFLSNHDTGRIAGFVGYDEKKVKFAGAQNLLMSGNVFIYYGEELGMSGSGKDENKRAPMYWSAVSAEGITQTPPGMEAQVHRFGALDEQETDADSIYSFYKLLIELRNNNPVLAKGSTVSLSDQITDGDICAVRKTYEDSSAVIISSFALEDSVVDVSEVLDQWKEEILLTMSPDETIAVIGTEFTLPPYGIIILIEK